MSSPKTKKQSPPADPAPAAPLVATVSRETLEATVNKTLSLLRAIGTVRAIRAAMGTHGYEASDHKEGWDLIHATSGFTPDEPMAADDEEVRSAIATLDGLDEDLFRLVRAVLTRHHPEQAAFVLAGIGPSVGAAAVVGVKELLRRLDVLEKGPERSATRKADHAALARLAKAGIGPARRAELAKLVAVAESVDDAPPAEEQAAQAADDQAYEQALIALRAWYEEWSNVGRVAVKRRDHLIRMGLAQRKAKKPKGEEPK